MGTWLLEKAIQKVSMRVPRKRKHGKTVTTAAGICMDCALFLLAHSSCNCVHKKIKVYKMR